MNQLEPIGPNQNQFSIRIKIHSRTYTPIFDSNQNPFNPIFNFILIHMHNFWFEWKSEPNQKKIDSNENQRHWSYNVYNAVMCRKESASKQESASKEYVVIINIMQLQLI